MASPNILFNQNIFIWSTFIIEASVDIVEIAPLSFCDIEIFFNFKILWVGISFLF